MTLRPLYRDLMKDDALALACREKGNRGLWYDKLFDLWERDGPDWCMPAGTAKTEWIARTGWKIGNLPLQRGWTRHTTPDRCGCADLLMEATKRIEALVREQGGVILEAVTAERLVTGTGLPHPVENGFLWHHTLGVPYLPGSGVKGVVLSWDRDWANDGGDGHKGLRDKVLGKGPERRDAAVDPGAAGMVAFLDALPPEPVTLDLDGVTPHDSPYYTGRGEVPPADWHSPTPIPFLAVAKEVKFRFAILPRPGADPALLEDARRWLERALTSLGAGAKTAVDHGRFKNVTRIV